MPGKEERVKEERRKKGQATDGEVTRKADGSGQKKTTTTITRDVIQRADSNF